CHLYIDTNHCFPSGYIFKTTAGRILHRPPPASFSMPNRPGWGWAALLLPYLEQEPLARQINWDLPVESPSNLASRTMILPIYVCPSDRSTGLFTVQTDKNLNLAQGTTISYAACFGALTAPVPDPTIGNGIFYRNSAVRIADVRDG